MSGDPYPKSVQLARRERRYHRSVASAKRWQVIAEMKQGTCRANCGAPAPNDMAHIIARIHGGPDRPWNVIPLCRLHHMLFDMRDPAVCLAVMESLSDEEYACLVDHAGEQVFEQRFGIQYRKAS